MLFAGLLLTVLAVDTEAKSPTPPLSALTSPTESARYALVHGCLAAARTGGRLTDAPNHFLRPDGKSGAYRMTGAGRIVITDQGQAGCYTRVGCGDADGLRTMALELLAAEAPLRPVFDSGPGSRDSAGSFRQETHCARLGGHEVAVLISTSDDRRRPPMQLSLVAGEKTCGAPSAP